MDTKMKRGYLEKTLSLQKPIKSSSHETLSPKPKKKKSGDNHDNKNYNRLLITINVLGSTGPIRFVANGDDNAEAVIKTALKVYAAEERLPVLGSDINCFKLYPADDEFDVLKPFEAIGCRGVRNFVLCKNQCQPYITEPKLRLMDSRKGRKWRTWIQQSWSFKILSQQPRRLIKEENKAVDMNN